MITPAFLHEELRRVFKLYPRNLVRNPGFEDGLKHWDLVVWSGSVDECAVTPEERVEGRYSVKIRSDAGADAALQQFVDVDSDAWYRLSGWVKTVGVAEVDAGAYTTLGAIEFADYSGTAAGGGVCYQDSPVKLVGDRGWTYVELVFKTTPRTRRIAVEPALSFGGRSKGTVYWDNIRLERLERPPVITGWLGPRFVCDMGAGNGRLVVNRGIKADQPSDPINVHGFAWALEFTANTAGTLTIEVDMYGDGDFKVYDTVPVGAGETVHYVATIGAVLMRIRYSVDATATAKAYLWPRW